jgi:hypothetical protein
MLCAMNKSFFIAAFLTAAALTGILSTTTMAVYADESETETEQKLKQSNVGSGDSTNDNCGQNLINSEATTECAEFIVDGLIPLE